jgi:cell fate (sporulation/competence/biofilm development) regulator YlbF (YheA/YmcA/DUF963 family)
MTATPTIETRIQELCEAIVADEEVCNARDQAEAFLADADAVTLYREMATMGRALHRKQHDGEEPSVIEARQFEDLQNRCDAHPAIVAFVEAQQVLQGIAETVNGYVTKTLEKGKVPTEEEVWGKSGGCGEGCGCH